MTCKIIADSCCDMTPALKKRLGVTTIPLSMTLGEKRFIDDETLNLPEFMQEMKSCTEKISLALPSPILYKETFEGKHTSFAVTLSSKLSGSYNSAVLGKNLALEDAGADAIIFDSNSASAGKVLIVLKIYKMIKLGFHKSRIVSSIENYIREMETYFVLDSVDNLQKNGRLNIFSISILGRKELKRVSREECITKEFMKE